MSEIILEKRYPHSRSEDITDAFMRGYVKGKADRPHGEWICHKGGWIDLDYYPTKYECDQCHHYVVSASDKNFCPNCGAKMVKDDE